MTLTKAGQLLLLLMILLACQPEKIQESSVCSGRGLSLINADGSGLWLPGTFTPNGDLYNDTYRVISAYLRQLKLVVSKDNVVVYQLSAHVAASNPQATLDYTDYGWKGTSSGQDAPEGVYQVALEGVFANQTPFSGRTSVYLMRDCHKRQVTGCETEDQYAGIGKISDTSRDILVSLCND